MVFANAGASLVDLGDGVLCVEFHSKLNTLGEDNVAMVHAGLEETNRNFEAMVIANEGETFSAGANLMLVLLAAQEGEWDELNLAVQRFQQMNMALKYAAKPVVAAPFSRALGGGCELVLHSTRAQASAETYIGLVEVGVGLIPAGGGCKELLVAAEGSAAYLRADRLRESLHQRRRCAEAWPAASLRFHLDESRTADLRRQGAGALAGSQLLARNAAQDIKVAGESAYALMKLGAWSAQQGHYISDYDVIIAEKLAHVLSGGRLTGEQTVSEQYLLDLEREAFLSLCGNPKTQERMQYMLKTGKPLRN